MNNGVLDVEGISCDDAGSRYILSETWSAVLKTTPQGEASWLRIEAEMLSSARAYGLLRYPNALFEGLAVSPAGDSIWSRSGKTVD